MAQLGFYFDQTRCLGCRACQVACKDRNNLPVNILFRHVTSYETGESRNYKLYNLAATCNHCASPACVANCPTEAMYICEDGTIQHDDSKCIGCETCVESCPYSVPQALEEEGIVRKCDSCKPFRDAGKNPVCVDACTMRAIEFGDIEELRKAHGADLVCDLPILPSSSETSPSILVKPRPAALEQDFRQQLV